MGVSCLGSAPGTPLSSLLAGRGSWGMAVPPLSASWLHQAWWHHRTEGESLCCRGSEYSPCSHTEPAERKEEGLFVNFLLLRTAFASFSKSVKISLLLTGRLQYCNVGHLTYDRCVGEQTLRKMSGRAFVCGRASECEYGTLCVLCGSTTEWRAGVCRSRYNFSHHSDASTHKETIGSVDGIN